MNETLKSRYDRRRMMILEEKVKLIDKNLAERKIAKVKIISEAFDKETVAKSLAIIKRLNSIDWGGLDSFKQLNNKMMKDAHDIFIGEKGVGIFKKIKSWFTDDSEETNPYNDIIAYALTMQTFFSTMKNYVEIKAKNESKIVRGKNLAEAPDWAAQELEKINKEKEAKAKAAAEKDIEGSIASGEKSQAEKKAKEKEAAQNQTKATPQAAPEKENKPEEPAQKQEPEEKPKNKNNPAPEKSNKKTVGDIFGDEQQFKKTITKGLLPGKIATYFGSDWMKLIKKNINVLVDEISNADPQQFINVANSVTTSLAGIEAVAKSVAKANRELGNVPAEEQSSEEQKTSQSSAESKPATEQPKSSVERKPEESAPEEKPTKKQEPEEKPKDERTARLLRQDDAVKVVSQIFPDMSDRQKEIAKKVIQALDGRGMIKEKQPLQMMPGKSEK